MHPTVNELKEFAAGRLPQVEARYIEDHLRECESCVDRLDTVDLSDDQLVGLLRDAKASCSPEESSLGSETIRHVPTPDSPQPESTSYLETPVSFGRYVIEEQLGRGGMGVVYRAFDPTLRRLVALKIIAPHRVMQAEDRMRFRREAEAAACLQHANIVQVFEFGEQDDTLYCAFELVEGNSLAERLAESALSPSDAARMIATLADAVDYAHARGVVHRDLKPANVLLSTDGTPKIADFGLAKRLDDDATHTIDGTLLGSPCYMAPEQARGELSAVGPATDVYALGAVLYESIVGRPPFQEADVVATLEQVKHVDAIPPSRIRCELDRDLETVCLKCLKKSAAHRYAHAADLATDLRRFLSGMPVSARKASLFEHGAKLARRHPFAAFASGLLTVALLTFLVVVVSYNHWLVQANEEVSQKLEDAQRKNYALQLQRAAVTSKTNSEQALRLLLDEQTCPVKLRDFCWAYLHSTCTNNLTFWKTGTEIRSLAVAPDRSFFATGDSTGTVRLWSVHQDTPVREIRAHDRPINDLSFSTSGNSLASVSDDGTGKIWNCTTGKLELTIAPKAGRINGIEFAPDKLHLVTAHSDGMVRVFRCEDGQHVTDLPGHEDAVFCVDFSPDGKYLASGSRDDTLRIWKTQDWGEHASTADHGGFVTDVKFHPQFPSRLATASIDRTVRHWTVTEQGQLEANEATTRFNETISSLSFSHDGAFLAAGCYDGMTYVSQVEGGQQTTVLEQPESRVSAVAFSIEDKLLTGTKEGLIGHWRTQRNSSSLLIDAHQRPVTGLVHSRDGSTIASTSYDGTVRLWNSRDGRKSGEWRAEEQWIAGVNESSDHRQFVWEAGGTAYVGQFSETRPFKPLAIPSAKVFPTAMTLINELVVVADISGVRFLDVSDGTERWSWKGDNILYLAASHDSNLIAAVGEGGQLWVGDTNKKTFEAIGNPGSETSCLAFSQDGRSVGLGTTEGKATIYHPATGQVTATMQGHSGAIHCIVFSPDGKTLATGGADRTVKLWDAVAGPERGTFTTVDSVRTLAFSPNSRALVAGSDDGTIRIWRAN